MPGTAPAPVRPLLNRAHRRAIRAEAGGAEKFKRRLWIVKAMVTLAGRDRRLPYLGLHPRLSDIDAFLHGLSDKRDANMRAP